MSKAKTNSVAAKVDYHNNGNDLFWPSKTNRLNANTVCMSYDEWFRKLISQTVRMSILSNRVKSYLLHWMFQNRALLFTHTMTPFRPNGIWLIFELFCQRKFHFMKYSIIKLFCRTMYENSKTKKELPTIDKAMNKGHRE